MDATTVNPALGIRSRVVSALSGPSTGQAITGQPPRGPPVEGAVELSLSGIAISPTGVQSPKRQSSSNRLLVDLSTQCDYLLPNGAAPVTNRVAVLRNIRTIMNWAWISKASMISSLECHRPDEMMNGFPPHCVDRTWGQRKIPFTLMPRRIVLHGDNTLDVPLEPFRRYQQVIVTKRGRDFFSNPKADRLVDVTPAKLFVVFGVLAERCVKTAVLTLLARYLRVAVVADACGHWCASDAELAMRQMKAKGAILLTTAELVSGKADANPDVPSPALSIKGSPPEPKLAGDNGRGNGKVRPGVFVYQSPPQEESQLRLGVS